MKLGGEGGKSFQFNKIGDGFDDAEIIEVTVRQQTDMDNDDLMFWYEKKPTAEREIPKEKLERCQPVDLYRLVLQTSFRNNEGLEKPMEGGDDGERTVDLSGNKYTAVKKASKNNVEPGGKISMRLLALGDPKKKGWSPPKLFIDPETGKNGVTYTPPSKAVQLGPDDPDDKESAPTRDPGPVASAPPSDKADEVPPWDTGAELVKPDWMPDDVWNGMPEENKRAVSAGAKK